MAVLQIPITKAGGATVDFDTQDLDNDTYQAVVEAGLKVFLNLGASKITKETYPDEAERKAAALAKATEQVEKVKKGEVKRGRKAKAKESAKVMTEARRIARNMVKDAMKEEGIKISHVKASEITAAANALIEADATIVEQAKANLEAAEASPKHKIDIKALVKTDPELVAKAEAKAAKEKADRGSQLSKTQAGKPKARKAKPAPQATA